MNIFEVAEIQLSYKSKVKTSMRPKITGSKDAHNVLRQYWYTDKLELVEQFKVMLLNRANQDGDKEDEISLEANQRYKSLNMYDADGKKIFQENKKSAQNKEVSVATDPQKKNYPREPETGLW